MAFEDLFVALRDDQFGKLRCQEPLQPPDAPQFLDLLRDPHLQAPIQLGYLFGALPQFAQQPRILHCDHRLRGEVLQQGDLLFGKRTYLAANSGDGPEQHVILAQWHDQEGTETDLDGDAQSWVGRLLGSALPYIGDMDDSLAFEHADQWITRAGPKAAPNQLAVLCRRRVLCCNPPERLAVIAKQRTVFSAAQAVRLIQVHVEHRGEVAGGGI